MQVFNPEFVDSVRNHLNNMSDKYVTREALCVAIGVSADYALAISLMLESGLLPEFEGVRSRGIRRRAEVKQAA